jgi:uncharacterized membrane protein YdjX (TVP38/TMEM64 family)
MRKLLAFLNNMDARAWRTVAITVVLLGLVGGMIGLGKSGLVASPEQMEAWLESLRASTWALPATIMVFVLTSFLAAPQFLLAAACMVAFGPVWGFIYGLVGTLVSSWLHFYMGRWGGASLVERYGGSQVNRLSRFIGRNDFVASAIVRNVPTAPAILVNMAFGASKADFWRFIAGVAVGSTPKILIVALFGQSVLSAMGGGLALAIGAAIAVAGISITVALAARKVLRGRQPDGEEPPALADTPPATAANPAKTAHGA